jgi:hypothetical protein
VRIGTLDNPGWSLRVQTTPGLELPRATIEHGDDDWWDVHASDGRFVGFGGRRNLTDLLDAYRRLTGHDVVDPDAVADLDRLVEWFARQCDGEWEHGQGVTLGLDDDGWRLDVQLAWTDLAGFLTDLAAEAEDGTDGVLVRVDGLGTEQERLIASSGPRGLPGVLAAFTRLLDGVDPSAVREDARDELRELVEAVFDRLTSLDVYAERFLSAYDRHLDQATLTQQEQDAYGVLVDRIRGFLERPDGRGGRRRVSADRVEWAFTRARMIVSPASMNPQYVLTEEPPEPDVAWRMEGATP